MTARLRTILAAVILGLIMLVAAQAPAHAAEDVIRELRVTYDVQPDGSVRVTHTYDWQFAKAGQRGIIVKFATRESWEDDPTKDVVYDLSDFEVSKPHGRTHHLSGQ